MAAKKKPKVNRLRVDCTYDKAKAIKVTGFMAPVRSRPGRWVLVIDTDHEKMYPPDDESEG